MDGGDSPPGSSIAHSPSSNNTFYNAIFLLECQRQYVQFLENSLRCQVYLITGENNETLNRPMSDVRSSISSSFTIANSYNYKPIDHDEDHHDTSIIHPK